MNDDASVSLAKLSKRQLRNVVSQPVRDHYVHVRAVSSEEFASRYFDATGEQAAIEQVSVRV